MASSFANILCPRRSISALMARSSSFSLKTALAGGVGEPASASDDLATKELAKRGAENQLPSRPLRQLRRSRRDSLEKPAHLRQDFRDLRGLRMRARDLHRGLISMTGLPGDTVQGQRPRGDGFGVFVRDSQTHEDRPPVVDQGDDPPHDLASLPILRSEA